MAPMIPDPDFGIGIRNVNGRIRMTYGSPYGLRFSKKGALTIVSILIPRVTRTGLA